MNLHGIKSPTDDIEEMLMYLDKRWDREYELRVDENRDVYERLRVNGPLAPWRKWSKENWRGFAQFYKVETGKTVKQ